MLAKMKRGLARHGNITSIRDRRARDREAVVTNVSNQLEALAESPLVAAKVRSRVLSRDDGMPGTDCLP
jgi:hypothetical protein